MRWDVNWKALKKFQKRKYSQNESTILVVGYCENGPQFVGISLYPYLSAFPSLTDSDLGHMTCFGTSEIWKILVDWDSLPSLGNCCHVNKPGLVSWEIWDKTHIYIVPYHHGWQSANPGSRATWLTCMLMQTHKGAQLRPKKEKSRTAGQILHDPNYMRNLKESNS